MSKIVSAVLVFTLVSMPLANAVKCDEYCRTTICTNVLVAVSAFVLAGSIAGIAAAFAPGSYNTHPKCPDGVSWKCCDAKTAMQNVTALPVNCSSTNVFPCPNAQVAYCEGSPYPADWSYNNGAVAGGIVCSIIGTASLIALVVGCGYGCDGIWGI